MRFDKNNVILKFGKEFDRLIYSVMKELSKADVWHYYINVTSNWYLK